MKSALEVASQIISKQLDPDATGQSTGKITLYPVIFLFAATDETIVVTCDKTTADDVHNWAEERRFNPADLQKPFVFQFKMNMTTDSTTQPTTTQLTDVSVQPSAVVTQPSDAATGSVVTAAVHSSAVITHPTDASVTLPTTDSTTATPNISVVMPSVNLAASVDLQTISTASNIETTASTDQ